MEEHRNRSLCRRSRRPEHGYVLITMTFAAIAIFGAVGLAVDVGRMFIAKSEAQAYCDSAALAAALKLDGTTTGITNAKAAVTGSTNKWNLGTNSFSSPTVTFATSSAGPWAANPNPATGYTYVRVNASVTMSLYFIPVVVGQTTQIVAANATAAQISLTSLPRGLSPYSAVSTNTTGPNFGMVPGNSYDIQWPQYNGTRANCSAANPDACFVSNTCPGETSASKVAVVTNWGANINGYWGSNSNSDIQNEILDVVQTQQVSVGDNIQPELSSGNKASEAGYLDQRVNEDTNITATTAAAYFADSTENGRRLLPVPILDPVDPTHTNVIGFGQFLLITRGSPSNEYTHANGNEPFCAIYVGPYNIGSNNAGAGGTTGASVVKLVL